MNAPLAILEQRLRAPSPSSRAGARAAAVHSDARGDAHGDAHAHAHTLVDDAVTPLLLAPAAKRARPRLLFAFASLAKAPVDDRLVDAAFAVELIHTASLLHDDVVDEAGERRGIPSANARYGNAAAVLAGDHALARALAALAFDARAVNAAVDVVLAMSASAVAEVERRGLLGDTSADVTAMLAAYDDVAAGKTGRLFGLCGRLAGLLANEPDLAVRFDDVGVHLGLAFQIADDMNDVATDLRERTPTLPILVAAARDAAVADAVRALWSRRPASVSSVDAAAVADRILAGPAPLEVAGVVRGHVERALGSLAAFSGELAHDEIRAFAHAL